MVEPMYKEGGSKNSKVKEVFFLFLWMGFTAFGGPAAHTAIFYDQVVRRRKWVDDQRFLDLLGATPVSYTHLRAHETPEHLVCRLLLEKKKNNQHTTINDTT
mgnify:CR=1 FL=1